MMSILLSVPATPVERCGLYPEVSPLVPMDYATYKSNLPIGCVLRHTTISNIQG
jgi:hypothetical protein